MQFVGNVSAHSLARWRNAALIGSSVPTKRILIIRLSSLGDLVLAASALSSESLGHVRRRLGSNDLKVDWLLSKGFEGLFAGDPRISRLWVFDRKAGVRAWFRLAEELVGEGYEEVWDLHSSLRSGILRIIFLMNSKSRRVQWRRFSKDRVRMLSLLFFRIGRWRAARPRTVLDRVAHVLGLSQAPHPSFLPLLSGDSGLVPVGRAWAPLKEGQRLYAVMPSSAWPGKCWSVANYAELARQLQMESSGQWIPVVLGTPKDEASIELLEQLRVLNIDFRDGVGLGSLSFSAKILAASAFYFGNDTGLAHLAESIGTPACVIHGPTSAELGFGPWRPESLILERGDLLCRPCSKDGKRCFRFWDPYACMKGLSVQNVLDQLRPRLAQFGLKKGTNA